MKDKEKKICITVKAFLEHPNSTNEELAKLTGFSSSSIQRYLNDPVIKELFNDETFSKIKELLSNNIKDDAGYFIGNRKSSQTNRLESKCNDILIFANIFLKNPNLSLEQIADFYNNYYSDKSRKVTRDYVYDCLSKKTSYSLLEDNFYEVISSQLEERRILGNKNGATETNNKRQK